MAVVEMHGKKWQTKTDLVLSTIDNTQKIARARNDQERVLWTQRDRKVLRIYVSIPELARRIGRVLQRTFKGKSLYHFNAKGVREPYLHVIWDSDRDSNSASKADINSSHRSKHYRRRGASK